MAERRDTKTPVWQRNQGLAVADKMIAEAEKRRKKRAAKRRADDKARKDASDMMQEGTVAFSRVKRKGNSTVGRDFDAQTPRGSQGELKVAANKAGEVKKKKDTAEDMMQEGSVSKSRGTMSQRFDKGVKKLKKAYVQGKEKLGMDVGKNSGPSEREAKETVAKKNANPAPKRGAAKPAKKPKIKDDDAAEIIRQKNLGATPQTPTSRPAKKPAKKTESKKQPLPYGAASPKKRAFTQKPSRKTTKGYNDSRADVVTKTIAKAIGDTRSWDQMVSDRIANQKIEDENR